MKIVIADRQARVRYGLRILLEQQPGWMIGGEAADDHELIELLRAGPPDLLLIDWELPDQQMEDLLKQARAQVPDLLVLMMSGKKEMCQAALRAGAQVFISKTDAPENLVSLIQDLLNRKASQSK